MGRYEQPYRLDAAVVEALLAHLNRLINASNWATRCDQGEMLVPLLTAHHLSTLINPTTSPDSWPLTYSFTSCCSCPLRTPSLGSELAVAVPPAHMRSPLTPGPQPG